MARTGRSRLVLGVALGALLLGTAGVVAQPAVADATSAGATSADVTSIGATSADVTSVGVTSIGATSRAASVQENATDVPPHVHPDEAADGDEAGLQRWLERELGSSLADGAVELEQGEYELARQHVDEEYRERLGQYATVVGDGGGETAEQLEATAEDQRALAELLEEYEASRQAYEAARDRGDEQRARELARELEALAEEIETLGVEVQANYETLDDVAAVDAATATTAVGDTVSEVRTQTDRVAEEALVATTLTATADGERVAYDDPLLVEGRLADADGEPIRNATIAVLDPAGATTTTTRTDGGFALQHRPVRLPANASELRVEYRPEPAAPYASATASVPAVVDAVKADLSVDLPDGPVAYGDTLALDVAATVDGTPVAGIPVTATLEAARSTTVTERRGTAVPLDVDASVRAGERTLWVGEASGERAVTVTSATRTVTVSETRTELTLSVDDDPAASGSAGGERASLAVDGRLATAAGEPLANETVRIAVDGEPAGTSTTDGRGRYAARLDASRADAATIRARFDGSGSSLTTATAEAAVGDGDSVGSGGVGGYGVGGLLSELGRAGPGGVPWVAIAGAALVPLGGLGLVAYRRRARRRATAASSTDETTDAGPSVAAGDPTEALDDAANCLGEDTDGATVLAYGAARAALADRAPAASGATHSEFLHACAADGVDAETVDALATVTECYEAATFAAEAVDEDTARSALAAARDLT